MAASHPAPSTSGVVGAEGRYPLDEVRPVPLVVGHAAVLPVGPLRMYTCGITPYDVTHVGHAATFVWADLVASLAHAIGSGSVVARNVTDIDDVLTDAARTRGRPYDELALTQEFLFDRDMKELAVAPPTVAPHARAHTGAVIRLAAALLEVGAAYEHDGFVYFRGYGVGAASGLDEEAALAASAAYGDQADVPGRESPFDVAVWRPSSAEHPAWPSPWGWGRPGWHAECAAMAMCALGEAIDVLVGGSDLRFPHHAYQQAMVETATGVRPFARSVLHVGEVRRDGVKMAKSTGNLVLVSDLLTRFSGAELRLGLLLQGWEQPWECAEGVFEAGRSALRRLSSVAGDRSAPSTTDAEVLGALASGLDVRGAVEVAMSRGADAARYLLHLLKLHAPSTAR